MFVLYAVSNIRGIQDINEEKYIGANHKYVTVTGETTVDKYKEYLELEEVEGIIPGNSMIEGYIQIGDLYQTTHVSQNLGVSIASIDEISKEDLIFGRMPENENEVVMDRFSLSRVYSIVDSESYSLGMKTPEKFLNLEMILDKYNETKTQTSYTIVGITDIGSPCMYVYESQFIKMIQVASGSEIYSSQDRFILNMYDESDVQKYVVYALSSMRDFIQITEGEEPKKDYEIIIPESLKSDYKLGKTIKGTVNGNELLVVGYYTSLYDLDKYYSNDNTALYNVIENQNILTIKTSNKEKILENLGGQGLNVEDILEKSKQEYEKTVADKVRTTTTIGIVIVSISVMQVFLMLRASFLSRVKEVGILRAIGMKKSDIYKMFVGEILAIFLITTVPGILFMNSILKGFTEISYFKDSYLLDINTYLISLIILLGVNLIFGLLPVWNCIRKTPAQILASNNVD